MFLYLDYYAISPSNNPEGAFWGINQVIRGGWCYNSWISKEKANCKKREIIKADLANNGGSIATIRKKQDLEHWMKRFDESHYLYSLCRIYY